LKEKKSDREKEKKKALKAFKENQLNLRQFKGLE
jgi:hypothetical protein